MNFRFTLNNSYGGSFVLSSNNTPGGWKDAVLTLERNEDYHSLVEMYDQPLLFFKDAMDYIKAIEEVQGPDAQITILIEGTLDGVNYDTVFNGLLDIEGMNETNFYKLEGGILRNDPWTKFINRKGTQVNLAGTTDLDGATVTPLNSFTLTTTTQSLQKRFDAYNSGIVDYGTAFDQYATIDFDKRTYNELTWKNEFGPIFVSALPSGLWIMDFAGSYVFDIQLTCYQTYSVSQNATDYLGGEYDIILSTTDYDGTTTTHTLTKTNQNPSAGIYNTLYSYSGTLTLTEKTEVRLYFNKIGTPASGFDMFIQALSTMTITAQTTFQNTQTDCFTVFNATKNILKKMIGNSVSFSSSFLDTGGCGSHYAVTKGLNIRGFSLSTKPMFLSFDDLWSGIDPILNLGLGYIGGTIVIEQKDYFYSDTISLNLSYVDKITRTYDDRSIFKTIQVGYTKWQAEADQGIDDPQSKRTYSTRFKSVGSDKTVQSSFIAASGAWEETRRQRWNSDKDWPLDNDTFILALKKTDHSLPEFDENFTSISGLINSPQRYNTRLSAARNLQRWLNYFSGCLKWYASETIKFASGDGNYDMSSTLSGSDCEDGAGVALSEKQNVTATTSVLYTPIRYTFDFYLTWAQYKAIRDQPTYSIGVSRTNSGHVTCRIMSLKYEVSKGLAHFVVAPKDITPL